MKKIRIAFSHSKDRPAAYGEVPPRRLSLRPKCGYVHWYDGSVTDRWSSRNFSRIIRHCLPWGFYHREILTGGSCRYIVKALTDLLAGARQYDYMRALWQNDVRLHDDWFEPTMGPFEIGQTVKPALFVGAVSARCYEDRVLIQRDGYCHHAQSRRRDDHLHQ